ncbi:hypothetical protein [Pseudorhodobacter turbinis]|uniref:hypothetical protein n=1 Tax=Pseudorhodobacter turbinis TaxID=2500533 RepID=UPI00143DE2D5|nr:hypothetical protein [Pseudorhodobacter turbinis]
MTRRFTACLAISGLVALVALDVLASPPNPYRAPPMLAFGSGLAASGGFCGALPD